MIENHRIHAKVPTRAQENRGRAKETLHNEERTSNWSKTMENEPNVGEDEKKKTKKKRTNGSARLRK